MDEATLRRIIREELDNYDRDKGITPRMSKSGATRNMLFGVPVRIDPSVPLDEAHFRDAAGKLVGKITDL